MKIFVRMEGEARARERTRTITVDPIEGTATIADLKARIQKQERIPVEQQALFLKHLHLKNNGKTLFNYKISNETTLLLRLNISDYTPIYVKTLDGKTVTLNFQPWDTVDSLKSQIYDKIGTPPAMQKLLFERRVLYNGRTLANQNITSGSTIYLVRRLVGYFNVVSFRKT